MRKPIISRVSPRALMISIWNEHSDQMLGTGTGFAIESPIGPCLVTARHCVTGRDHFTGSLGPTAAIPSEIRIYHRTANDDGSYASPCLITSELLYTAEFMPRWYEHHRYGHLCDFVVLPLSDLAHCSLHFVNPEPGLAELTRKPERLKMNGDFVNPSEFRVHLTVGEQVSVIGFPFRNFVGNTLPLWIVGHLSSEPEISSGFDCFFIDCRARKGQSGSPVYVKRRGETPIDLGETILFDGFLYSFLGVYTGRINSDSDVGMVWSASAIWETAKRLKAAATAAFPDDRKIGGPLPRLGSPVSA